MKTNYKVALLVLAVSIFLVTSVFVLAKPNADLVLATNNKAGNVVSIPAHAVEVTPDVFSLGTATDVDGRIVEGYAIIHRKDGEAKPPWAGGDKNSGSSKCYSFLAGGAKWKTLEAWIVNPANTQNLTNDFVFNNLRFNIGKWEDASSTNILGDGNTTTTTLVADTQSPDGKNEVYFGSIDSPGVIAVTIVWGVFSGPTKFRYLAEWDQIYDQVDFSWSSSGGAGKMDFENIATHEIGHSIGMGHPSSGCTEETMYAYADFGETKKRTLNTGDVAGVNNLY